MSEVMTNAIIGMPIELAMHSKLSQEQFYLRAQSLLAENATLLNEVQRITEARRLEWNNAQQVQAERDSLAIRVKELDLLFGRYILAMRSSLIEEEHGKGPAAGMEWIYNSLAGPGELPPEGETDSQAYFDREIVAVDRGMAEVMAFHEARRAGKAVRA